MVGLRSTSVLKELQGGKRTDSWIIKGIVIAYETISAQLRTGEFFETRRQETSLSQMSRWQLTISTFTVVWSPGTS